MSTTNGVAHRRRIELDDTNQPDWVERDPARAAALGLIVIAVVVRVVIALQGFLANDDFVLDGQAAVSALTPGYAFHMFNNHLMPGGLVVIWAFVHIFGLVYWPYVVVLAIGELIVGVLFYRLLRTLIGPGWRVMIPLAVLMFTPLTLEATSGVIVGFNVLPMQMATILGLGAMYRYTRTGSRWHLVSLAGAMLLGLLFFEKSLLIAPLLFVATACLFVTGGFWLSLRRTVNRYWPAWLLLVVICGGYLGLYLSRTTSSSLRSAGSLGAVLDFVGQFGGQTVATSLVGGPWVWLNAGDVAADAAPPLAATAVAVVAVVLLVGFTIARRPPAGRAWLMAGVYLLMVGALLTFTRLGGLAAGAEGQAPRYAADAAPVIALALAIAVYGLVGEATGEVRPLRVPRELTPLIALAALVVVTGTAFSLYGYGHRWSIKAGRDYLANAEADLARAPAGTVFFDAPVPAEVVQPLFYPDTLESHFFRALKNRPTFVDQASKLSTFDSTGHVRPATISGRQIVPPTEKLCGYRVTGTSATTLPLTESIYVWPWAVEVSYISSGETTATLRMGAQTRQFPVHYGPNQYFFHLDSGGDAFQLSVADPAVVLCTFDIAIGTPAPVPA